MKLILTILFFYFTCTITAQQLKIEVFGIPNVGDSVEVVIKASHVQAIKEVWLVRDNDYENQLKKNCNSATTCEVRSKISLDYEGSIRIRSFLWEFPNKAVTSLDTSIQFKCKTEYCKPDTLISKFFLWMRNKGYDEAIIAKYYNYAKDGIKRAKFKEFYNNPLVNRLKPTMNINFYDIIPTDQNSTFVEMSPANAAKCTPSSLWPEFCPVPRPADYKMIEEHLTRVFGVNYKVNYIRKPINYKNEIGPPTLTTDGKYEFNFSKLNIFEFNNFNRGDIVHYGIRTLDNKAIVDGTMGTHVARMFKNFITGYDISVFTHELGHSYGFPHTFLGNSSPYDFFSLDGIMSNTYTPDTPMFDPLDPLERYSLEPIQGYLDDNSYVNKYNNGIKPTVYFNNIFKNLDPYVLKLSLINLSSSSHVFETELGNLGTIDCPFFEVSLFNNDKIIENRIIENILPGKTIKMEFTVPNAMIEGNNFSIKVDPANQITDENENNNYFEINLTSLGNESNDKLHVLPNPVSNELFVSQEGPWDIKVFNLMGSIVLSETIMNSISLENLVNGTYFIYLKDKNSGKIVLMDKIQVLK